jgi:hypothetical protein
MRTAVFAAAVLATVGYAWADGPQPRPKPETGPGAEDVSPYPQITALELASQHRRFSGQYVVVHGCTFFGAGTDVVFCAWGERAEERLSIPVNAGTIAPEIMQRLLADCTDFRLRDRCQFPVTAKIDRNIYGSVLMAFVRTYVSPEELERARERMAETPGRGFAEGFDGSEFIDKDL